LVLSDERAVETDKWECQEVFARAYLQSLRSTDAPYLMYLRFSSIPDAQWFPVGWLQVVIPKRARWKRHVRVWCIFVLQWPTFSSRIGASVIAAVMMDVLPTFSVIRGVEN
jgi:hypothetical protein